MNMQTISFEAFANSEDMNEISNWPSKTQESNTNL